MKTLLLLRHAKSSWDDDSLTDKERPLAPRGRRAAPRMAQYIMKEDLIPDLVLCSTSVRTRETWEAVEDEFDTEVPVEFLDSLYLADPGRMLRLVKEHGGKAETLMVVSHNPGTHELALALTQSRPNGQVEKMDRKFPTAALAVIRFDVNDWAGVAPGLGELVRFMRPKDLT